jgi:hypothetical protein
LMSALLSALNAFIVAPEDSNLIGVYAGPATGRTGRLRMTGAADTTALNSARWQPRQLSAVSAGRAIMLNRYALGGTSKSIQPQEKSLHPKLQRLLAQIIENDRVWSRVIVVT